ncbi:MAG TPA: hypothetical protein VK671_09150 [Mucilaginibacter sp.]|jgi:hypothetical protein|nr:hypothetical protein [Mucilaginibacter sp.]
MKSLIELYKDSTDIKLEIDILIAETNNPANTLELRLSTLTQITLLHQKLNSILHEIKERRANKLTPA